MSTGTKNNRGAVSPTGFTLIELMIVVAIIAIITTLALPVYSNYAIRSKIGEGLSVANAAKTAVSSTCNSSINLTGINNTIIGWDFIPTAADDAYVQSIQASGPCTAPLITITTKNTGYMATDPILILTGALSSSSGQIEWQCRSSNTPNYLLPSTCRS